MSWSRNSQRFMGAVFVALVGTLALTLPAQGVLPGASVPCERVRDVLGTWTTTLRGDVDGDGRTDTVRTRATWNAKGECRAWLMVDTAHGRFQTPVVPAYTSLLKPPGLAGLVRLGPGHRLSIAVVVWLGASTGFLDVYSLRGQALERASATEYEYAGSVVHPSGVDCARRRGATLVASTAQYVYEDGRYHVTRSFYAMRGGVLTLVPRLTERLRVRVMRLGRFPEFLSAPFPSCTAVRGTS